MTGSWIYSTEITPYNIGEDTSEQKKKTENFKKAYAQFIQECCVPQDQLMRSIHHLKRKIDKRTDKPYQKYRIFMDLSDGNDVITMEDGATFLKSKFLSKYNFKKDLISYYKPLDLFVRGPYNITTKSNFHTNKWTIDLYWND